MLCRDPGPDFLFWLPLFIRASFFLDFLFWLPHFIRCSQDSFRFLNDSPHSPLKLVDFGIELKARRRSATMHVVVSTIAASVPLCVVHNYGSMQGGTTCLTLLV